MTKPKSFTGVRAKLSTYREANQGSVKRTLPKSGIEVEIPKFLNHGAWMRAQRQAGGDTSKAQAAFVVGTVSFEDEKLTMADIQSGLLGAMDMLFLISEIFDDGSEKEKAEGKGEAEV